MKKEIKIEFKGVEITLVYDPEAGTVIVTAIHPIQERVIRPSHHSIAVSKVDKDGQRFPYEPEGYDFTDGNFLERLEVAILDRISVEINMGNQSGEYATFGIDVLENEGLRLN